jgi:hypothetical protein
VLIKAYGQYWNPDAVDWGSVGQGNKGELLGTVKIDSKTILCDAWEQRGIYTLHDKFRLVYVGKTADQNLGKRLRDHLSDRFAGRWDLFCWYGIRRINKTGTLRAYGRRWVPPETIIQTLEALAILVSDAPLNRKREKLPEASFVDQAKCPHPRTVRHYLEQILDRLPKVDNA